MKLINQSYNIINQTDFSEVGILKYIERCARVSYKSEDRMTDTSYEKFVGMLESRDHARPLEFGTVHLRMSDAKFETIQVLMEGIYNDSWIKYNIINTENEDNCYITTNYRYYLEMCKRIEGLPIYLDEFDKPFYPRRYTAHMILGRGVMDEFRTHVGLSHLAESTRYCNYSKGKFGGEVTFIKPNWYIDGNYFDTLSWSEKEKPSAAFQIQMKEAEECYLFLLERGCKPQEAREVLPLAVKSELISCGFEDAWENFFYRRNAKDAHPMAQEIAKPMHEEFIKRGFISK